MIYHVNSSWLMATELAMTRLLFNRLQLAIFHFINPIDSINAYLNYWVFFQYTICEQKQDTFTESILRIENILLEDEGLYSCATRLNNGELSASAHNKKITVLSSGMCT